MHLSSFNITFFTTIIISRVTEIARLELYWMFVIYVIYNNTFIIIISLK